MLYRELLPLHELFDSIKHSISFHCGIDFIEDERAYGKTLSKMELLANLDGRLVEITVIHNIRTGLKFIVYSDIQDLYNCVANLLETFENEYNPEYTRVMKLIFGDGDGEKTKSKPVD